MQDATEATTPNAPPAALVTVIVRSLDRGTLRQALASVVTQTWPAIEVLVVAAKPGHGPLPALADLPPHTGQRELRLLSTDEPRPRSRNANVGLDAARGAYLIFLDDDDTLMPAHIERLVRALQAHETSLAAYTGVALVDADLQPQGQVFDLPFDAVRQLSGNITPIHAVLFDARLLQRGCRFDEQLDRYEDWDFWLQLARLTVFTHLPGVSALYRIHDSSGVHEDVGAERASSARIYTKWQRLLGPEQLGDLMRRVWSHGELEARLEVSEQCRVHDRQTAESALSQIVTVKHHVDGLRPSIDGVQQLLGQQQALLLRLGQDDAVRVEHVGKQIEGYAASLNQQIAQVQDQLQARNEAQAHELAGLVARQQAQVEQQTQALQSLHLLVEVQTDTAGRWALLDQQLGQHAAAHAQNAAGVAELVGSVQALESRAAQHEASLAQARQDQQQQAAGLDQHLLRQVETLARLENQLAQQTERETALRQELQALRSSTSWRITYPLRVVVDVLTRPFRRGGSR